MLRFTLKQLAYFVAAAEHESVTIAARRLNVSQPSISAAIAHLERVFDVQLFLRRHAQGISLTTAGQRALQEARSLLAQAGELSPRIAGDSALGGNLELGCYVTVSPRYLPGLLREFKQRHGAIEVRLHEGDTETLRRDLATGAIEVALMYDLALGAEFVCEKLSESIAYALLPAGHRLARKRSVSVTALAAEPFVLLDLPYARDYFRSIFLRFGVEPIVRYRTVSIEMMRGLVASGHGVGLLNPPLPGDIAYDGTPLACRPLTEDILPLRIVLARFAQARPTRAAEAFAACARDYFARVVGPMERIGGPAGRARRG